LTFPAQSGERKPVSVSLTTEAFNRESRLGPTVQKNDHMDVDGNCDADSGNCLRRSMSRMSLWEGTLYLETSKKQLMVSRCTIEAEYREPVCLSEML
jgi:hypothetical protein